MKTPLLCLALVPALLLTSCYVTPAGGPYGGPGPGPHLGSGRYDTRNDYNRHDHDRDRRDNDRDRYDRDHRDNDRDGRDGRSYGRTSPSSYRGPVGTSTTTVTVVRLPSGARRVVHGGSTYYTSGSTWYRPSGSGYVRIARPY